LFRQAGRGAEKMKRLTKPEKLLNEQMLAILKWAAELLEKRGAIEIRRPMNHTG
jgi:hypothetical protein